MSHFACDEDNCMSVRKPAYCEYNLKTPTCVSEEGCSMVSHKNVEEQLKRVGCNFALWGRSEIHELSNVLMPDEIIAQATNGSYEGGFALLCVTQYRVLLIDKKPML